jgi:hypothetical protein
MERKLVSIQSIDAISGWGSGAPVCPACEDCVARRDGGGGDHDAARRIALRADEPTLTARAPWVAIARALTSMILGTWTGPTPRMQ